MYFRDCDPGLVLGVSDQSSKTHSEGWKAMEGKQAVSALREGNGDWNPEALYMAHFKRDWSPGDLLLTSSVPGQPCEGGVVNV